MVYLKVSDLGFKKKCMQSTSLTGKPGCSVMDQLFVSPEKVAKRSLTHGRVWSYVVHQILLGFMWEKFKEEFCVGC